MNNSDKTKIMIWFSLLGSLILFTVITFVMRSTARAESQDEMMNTVILIMGLSLFGLAFFLEKRFVGDEVSRYVFGLALNESCAIMGVCLWIISSNRFYSLFLIAVAFIGHFLRFPKKSV